LHGAFAQQRLLLDSRLKTSPTSDTHHTRGRRFNAEKATLFSGIKQPYLLSCTSSYLAFRKSLPITHSREINFTPTLNRRRYACMARLRRTSFIKFAAKAAPTSDTHHTVGGVLTPKK